MVKLQLSFRLPDYPRHLVACIIKSTFVDIIFVWKLFLQDIRNLSSGFSTYIEVLFSGSSMYSFNNDAHAYD